MNKILLILVTALLWGCDSQVKPDLVMNGKEYIIAKRCVKSHTKTDFTYHYGYNFLSGKFEWHWGNEDIDICDKFVLDTIEVNKEKKYYTKNN